MLLRVTSPEDKSQDLFTDTLQTSNNERSKIIHYESTAKQFLGLHRKYIYLKKLEMSMFTYGLRVTLKLVLFRKI